MNQLKDARHILKILEREGFEGYIVGGAVRDYLLKEEPTDIDITTNARPREVLNLFKGIPTGEKYGTVTINFKDHEYQVTTFRSERGYDDYRHPEVIFETDVLEDVKRRDFTINGLLMNSSGLIIDHVDGKKDLKHKYIKAIGNPSERFNEDALRMLRAFYFQSKLGFEIDEETMDAIRDNRELIKEISAERVLDETLKILQGKHLKKTLESMVITKVNEVLPGLKEGIIHFSKEDEMPLTDIFFITSFALAKEVPSYWKFPNKHRHKYRTVSNLANSKIDYDAKDLYEYGLEFTQAANRVNFNLKRDELRVNEIKDLYDSIPIKSSLDLKFRANNILKTVDRKAGAWVNNILTEMVYLVLEGKLKNDYNNLKEYVLNNVERF